MEVNFDTQPDALPWRSMYKLMIGSIVPRPIGWISTVNAEGQPNLAPYSFFNAVCANPPTVLFCPGVRATDKESKDTLNNIRENGEFVVNIVTEALADAMNQTATELPADVDEFAFAGLTTAPSTAVRPPRVAESPIHFECKMTHVIDIHDGPGGGSVVIGRVHHVHVDESVLVDGDKIDIAKLQPIGRLAGTSYCHVNDFFDMVRLPTQVLPSE